MNTYTIWNPNFVAQYEDKPADTFEELQEVERTSQNTYSSTVRTDDIDGLVQAIQNETNASIKYEEWR